jgi:DNA-binding transcriptional MerR regulator
MTAGTKKMATISTTQQVSYSIGVVARLTGLTTHTLRMWERRYGLGASKRTKTGQREFTKVDLDHLKLIKLLIDDGLRIGDIAKLPKKTLSALNIKSDLKADSQLDYEPISTTIIGRSLSNYFTSHSKRYPKLNMDMSRLTIDTWLQKESAKTDARVFFLEIDRIIKTHIKPLKQLSLDNKSVVIAYKLASHQDIEELKSSGITMLQGELNSGKIDPEVKKSVELQTTKTLLKRSTEQFNLGLPLQKPRYFDESELENAANMKNILDCECPNHISEIIKKLNEFENYSQQCDADNWNQAATHACIYAYTSQARSLMEQALMAVINEQELATAAK